MDAAGSCELRDDLGLKENESITTVLVDWGAIYWMLITVNVGLPND